jgi:hypothetical protein
MSETDTLVDSFPNWLRRPIQIVLLAGAIIGSIASIFGFFSFLARLFWWHDLWIWIGVWTHSLPHNLFVMLQETGFWIHRSIEAYRETIYPVVYAVTHFLPFKIPTWSIDAFFIGAFSLVAAWRIRTKGGYRFGEGMFWWRDYGLYLPFWLIAQLGAVIISALDGLLATVSFRRIRLFQPMYRVLPEGIDDFIFGGLAVSAVLVLFLGIDAVYLRLVPH